METQASVANKTAETKEAVTLDVSSFPSLEQLERQYLNLVLERNGGNKATTAKILGVSVKTIYNKLDAYKVTSDETVRRNP